MQDDLAVAPLRAAVRAPLMPVNENSYFRSGPKKEWYLKRLARPQRPKNVCQTSNKLILRFSASQRPQNDTPGALRAHFGRILLSEVVFVLRNPGSARILPSEVVFGPPKSVLENPKG